MIGLNDHIEVWKTAEWDTQLGKSEAAPDIMREIDTHLGLEDMRKPIPAIKKIIDLF